MELITLAESVSDDDYISTLLHTLPLKQSVAQLVLHPFTLHNFLNPLKTTFKIQHSAFTLVLTRIFVRRDRPTRRWSVLAAEWRL